MYLLDTNIVSESRKLRPHGGVFAWINSVPAYQLRLSAVTLAEIQTGIEMTRLQDRAKAAALDAWASQIEEVYEVLPMNSACFRLWARMMHGTSNTLFQDCMIAATARIYGLTVVTRNVGDFKSFEVPLLNPFSFGAA